MKIMFKGCACLLSVLMETALQAGDQQYDDSDIASLVMNLNNTFAAFGGENARTDTPRPYDLVPNNSNNSSVLSLVVEQSDSGSPSLSSDFEDVDLNDEAVSSNPLVTPALHRVLIAPPIPSKLKRSQNVDNVVQEDVYRIFSRPGTPFRNDNGTPESTGSTYSSVITYSWADDIRTPSPVDKNEKNDNPPAVYDGDYTEL